MTPVIRLQGVTKRFGSHVALDNASLEVPSGIVFALLGENGAGKTTCIRIMLGLAEADAGHAEVFGLDSLKYSLDIRRRAGYVSEQPTLYDWMTVNEIGWFAAGFYSEEFLTRYRDLTDRFELPARKKLKTLSKGMRAKVSLALALANDPALLVLDEPTSGLDTMVRREFLESMVDRAAEGKTVFLSSHQINEVERVADVVAIMHHGRLVVVDRLEKLKAEVVELTVTLRDPSAEPPLVQGELLRQRRRSRQWQLLVRGPDEASVAALDTHVAVECVDSRTPSLEEIFVGRHAWLLCVLGRSAETAIPLPSRSRCRSADRLVQPTNRLDLRVAGLARRVTCVYGNRDDSIVFGVSTCRRLGRFQVSAIYQLPNSD